MLGSLHAGLAFSNASLGAVHAMAHSLGGYLDLPHGECNALLLEHVIRFNMEASTDRYRRIGERMGMDMNRMTDKERINRITAALSAIRKQIGIEDGLTKRGVHSTDVSALAIHAFKDVCLVTNPRRTKLGDIKAIYDEAL